MKAAVSVPDATFERAERYARQLGVSQSEFFARAAARYADDLDEERVVDDSSSSRGGHPLRRL